MATRTFFRRSPKAEAAVSSKLTAEAVQTPSRLDPDPGFVPVQRPPDATEESLRGLYPADARLFEPSKNCTTCYGGGYKESGGAIRYCDCRCDQNILAKTKQGKEA